MLTREEGRALVEELVNKFEKNYSEYVSPSNNYNEIELRSDFLNPLLIALGWDVTNEQHAPRHLRDVIQEDFIEIDEGSTKKPDYSLYVNGKRTVFIEAKKPSVAITSAKDPAFQIRRYGWNAKMLVSILTNFDKIAIYECSQKPNSGDDAHIARLRIYSFKDLLTSFDEIYNMLSRAALHAGKLEQIFGSSEEQAGAEPFDKFFLGQIEKWRYMLAIEMIQHRPDLTQDEIGYLVQRLINRIIFLRICEDRRIERYKTLESIKNYEQLRHMFLEADKKYNSGLFDFVEDKLSLNVIVGSDTLIAIFKELYFPQSPFAFSVVESSLLGEIYELFLGKYIQLETNRVINVIEKPEVVASNGIVPTPDFIVKAMIARSLHKICEGKSPQELSHIYIADIACGSGSFLLAAYQYLLDYHLDWYSNNSPQIHPEAVYKMSNGEWCLHLGEKHRILKNNIYGVDIDERAVEVTQFSLLLKVLEDESRESLNYYLQTHKLPALPKLRGNVKWGNSLIDNRYFIFDSQARGNIDIFATVNPFNWEDAFPHIMSSGGFDLIIGNPPYVRIQNMVRYSPKEIMYYQSNISNYHSGMSDNFDKYFLFIERSLTLLHQKGQLCYIVPNKFFALRSGKELRKLITENKYLLQIVNFGSLQVFGNAVTTYSCILQLSKSREVNFTVEHVLDLVSWRSGNQGQITLQNADDFTEERWVFVPPRLQSVFKRMEMENPLTLENIADIFVGLQTSKDELFIITPLTETESIVTFTDKDGAERTIEREILKPCLYKAEVPAFGEPKANKYIVFPYKITEKLIRRKTEESWIKTAELIPTIELQQKFPLCWEYFSRHKHELLHRSADNLTDEAFYGYGRSQSLMKFDGTPKLIWYTLSLSARYAYDSHNSMFTGGGNGPYYALKPIDGTESLIFYILAVLAHPIVDAYVLARSSAFRGGYISYGKQFIEKLPFRMIKLDDSLEARIYNEIVQLVQNTITVTGAWISTNLPNQKEQLQRQILALRGRTNDLIAKLYNFSNDDFAVTIDWLQQRNQN